MIRVYGRRTLATNQPILALEKVDAGYGEIEVLRGVSLSVYPGQIVTIIGANGAGKTTLLRTVFGQVKPSAGRVSFDGTDITGAKPIDLLKRGISYIPGGRSNFPLMTVQENLEMGAYTRKDKSTIQADIDALCERFVILREKRHTPAGNLSGGQQQMVEFAIALMLKPRLMLIDEPTIGLAPILVDEVFRVIQEIHDSGTTIVLVEQNARRALEVSDFGFVLELGTIRYQGDAETLKSSEEVYQAYLGER
jgi:branched-chain amino acid transport system ATP-binding protein